MAAFQLYMINSTELKKLIVAYFQLLLRHTLSSNKESHETPQ